MKNALIIVVLSLAALFFISGIVWECIIFFQNWKYVLTPFGKIAVYWKPISLIFLSITMLFLSIIIDNKIK